MIKVVANRKEGFQLLHEGQIEISHIESNGVRIDLRQLEWTEKELPERIATIRTELQKTEVWQRWKKRFGSDAGLSKREQLATILYGQMGYKVPYQTRKGKDATDEEALMMIRDPFIPMYLRFCRLEKALNTYVKGLKREICNGRIHPSILLHSVRTYRSSCVEPNIQNQPTRDKEIAQIIRSLFIASEGCVIVENDFKGVEVSGSACYHGDPNFISYINDSSKDMHRDMAAQVYKLEEFLKSWNWPSAKEIRYGAKNKCVFPFFYGSYYRQCAGHLWDWIEKGKLVSPDGRSLFDWMKSKGISKLGACDPEAKPIRGTFEHHLQEVENDFWQKRFPGYAQWKRDWYNQYLRFGYFDMLTGFRVYGHYDRNSVVNYPIQGSAFHFLLWTLIQVNQALRKYRMKSKVIFQIHDSLIGDVKIPELSDYLQIVEETVTVKLRKHYRWLDGVALSVEYEIAPSNGTWFDKREIQFSKGIFHHPDKSKKQTTTDPFAFVDVLDAINPRPRNN